MPFSWAASSAVGDLLRDRERLVERDRSAGDAIGERRPFDQLQHQRAHTSGLFEAVDGADVRMVQRREDLRLALEARQAVGSRANASGSILSATSRPSLVSRARHTSPMPPAPMTDCTS